MSEDIESLSLSCRVVLLSMTRLSLAGETPAHTGEVIRTTTDHIESVEADTVGKIAEAEVNRALNRLEADGVVDMAEMDETSAVGKGRPAYTLDVDVDTVVETLGEDDSVAPLVETIRSEV